MRRVNPDILLILGTILVCAWYLAYLLDPYYTVAENMINLVFGHILLAFRLRYLPGTLGLIVGLFLIVKGLRNKV